MDDILLIYTPLLNSRINYIFTHIFFRRLKQNFILTTNAEEFISHKGPKVSYHTVRLCDELHFLPHGLLHEALVRVQEIEVSEWEGMKVFFRVEGNADMPFDLFATSFYLITRYEEYLPYFAEKFERYEASESLAFKQGFLHLPVVDKWIMHLRRMLSEKYPALTLPRDRFTFQSTIDIDNPFAFLHKGFFRTMGSLAKTMLRFDIKGFISRILTLQGARHDPYFTYGYIHRLEREYGFQSIYFFLVGDYGRYDTNIPIKKLAYQNLILDIHGDHYIGLHSSFNSNKSFAILMEEKERLTKVINEPILRSRQHYIMLKMPDTYQKLMEVGIKEDYSMGFASVTGFRAGTCFPFKFYDLFREREAPLTIYPFQVMEVTLHNYMRLRPNEAIEHIRLVIDEVKAVGGQFISLWHNESLSEYGMWSGWRKVFEQMVAYAVKLQSEPETTNEKKVEG